MEETTVTEASVVFRIPTGKPMNILKHPHELLNTAVKPTDINDPDFMLKIKSLEDTYKEVSLEAKGLAATQLGLDLCAFIARIDGLPRLFVNPEIVSRSTWETEEKEGCLSVPGVVLYVRRPRIIVVKYKELVKEPQPTWIDREIRLSGSSARTVQHEYDHLQGKLIMSHPVVRVGNRFYPNKVEK